MEYDIYDFLNLLGSLGVFLYGMKLMSESLQKVAGSKMRSILASMTSNRFRGLFTGVLITTLIQSSSATTVMVVSFVNAGLLSLTESIGVIMGANIGTTVTAWLISILGFKVSMAKIALPMVGISLPFLFSTDRSKKSWGELITGFALLFIGLDFLKHSVPNISNNPEVLGWLTHYSELGYLSYFLFLGIGTILTIVIQSSSATMALTLVMCNNGWIGYDMAAAMVLGENIGTTITANLAALVANTSARRAARAHLVFNVFGVIWMLLIFPLFLKGIASLAMYLGEGDPFTTSSAIPVALSLFHTTFNIVNAFLLIGTTSFIAKTVTRLVSEKKGSDDESFTLRHIKTGLLSTPEASIYLAREEIALFGHRVNRMFHRVQKLMNDKGDKKFNKQFSRIEKNEESCDQIEIEIANYLTKISETRLSERNSRILASMFKLIDNIESVGDSCFIISKAINRAHENHIVFPEKINNNLDIMFNLVNDSLEIMEINLKSDQPINAAEAKSKEAEINTLRDILKKEHLVNIEKGNYNYQTGLIYNDIVSECERLADYAINITQSLESV